MILNLLNLDGMFPQHIETSPNPCFQNCDYCYAKIWKREFYSADKILNAIIREGNKSEGLLGFYLRKKEPIALSNRTDIVSHPEWYELLRSIKRLGFPLYIQTKGSHDFYKALDFLDEKDTVYFTITGSDLYEERNQLNTQEKIKLAQKFSKENIYINIAFNPWISEKINVKRAVEIVEETNPRGVIARPYHDPKFNRTDSTRDVKSLYSMKEDKTGKARKELLHLADELIKKDFPIDIDFTHKHLKYFKEPRFVYKYIDNERRFGGGTFVVENELIEMAAKEEDYKRKGYDAVFLTFEEFIKSNEKVINYHKEAVVTGQDICHKIYKFKPEKRTYSYYEYLEIMWRHDKFFGTSHYIPDDDRDESGRHVLFYVLKEAENENQQKNNS